LRLNCVLLFALSSPTSNERPFLKGFSRGLSLSGLLRLTVFRVSVVLSVILVVLYIINPPILELFELKAYDTRLRWRGELPTSGQIVIVGIDEKSLQELGQWPWPRILMAKLIETLSNAGARVVGLDIVWPEPEQRVGILDVLYGEASVLGETSLIGNLRDRFHDIARENPEMDAFLREARRGVHPDFIFANAIKESQKVVLGNFFFMHPEEIQSLTNDEASMPPLLHESEYPVVRKGSSSEGSVPFLLKPFRIKENIPVLAKSARAFGYFNMLPDPDGVVRSIPLVMEYEDHMLVPLSLQTLRYSDDPSSLVLFLGSFGVARVQWKDRRIPTSELGLMYINYRGKSRTFPYLSAVDVLRKRVPSDEIRDKIILLGAVATGIYDLRVTPLDTVFPGVEIHASIIDNILQGDFIVRPEWTALIDMLILVLLGLLFGWVFPRLRPLHGAVFMLIAFTVHLYLNAWVLVEQGIWLNVIYPSLMIPVSYLGVTLYRYIHEEKEKRMIKGAFQFYVTPSVVNQMLQDPNALRLGGQRRELTVLFSDIRGFTSISESLNPEGLVHLLNEYLTEMTNVVFRHDGTLDKYIGDAIMAIYGAPIPQQDHPMRACLTALDMMNELHKLHARWKDQAAPPIDIGIGINTGEMVVGNMGSERRFDYTVMGDHVNLASRLEGLNRQYGTHIITSEFTYPLIQEHLLCRELDYVRVKGRAKPVRIYEILGRGDDQSESRLWVEPFEQGLVHYRAQDWAMAVACFEKVVNLTQDDSPSRLYLERCRILQSNPPPADWDGVFEWETK
jgi:adenylate cyclase